jgi:cytochrome o ubiquinol oxidase subunit 2
MDTLTFFKLSIEPALNILRKIAVASLLALLTGCRMVVMSPSGDIAAQQRDLVLVATGLMLLIIVPVIVLTLLFAWKYRQSNAAATYTPDWHHSTRLEIVIWAAPLSIIFVLGAVTWMGTHLLDPYRPLDRLGPSRPIAAGAKPLRVEVVALDWKWLFVYPDLGIATVNELAAPVDTPIDFQITASSVMNSFSIPALAGQIYAMPGMQTQLHAVINRPGDYQGFSANYSGEGFSSMRFVFHGMGAADFARWTAAVKAGGVGLDRAGYLALERPSEHEPVRRYAAVAPGLYTAILNRCVEPGKMCASDMMRVDARGGLGLAGARNVLALEYDKHDPRGDPSGVVKRYVQAICDSFAVQRPDARSTSRPPAARASLASGAPTSLTPPAPSPAGASITPAPRFKTPRGTPGVA